MKIYKVLGCLVSPTEYHFFREIPQLGLLCKKCNLLIHLQEEEYYKITNFISSYEEI